MAKREEKRIHPHPSSFVSKERLAKIKGYVVHEKRTPRTVFTATPEQTIGPFFPTALVNDEDRDLTRLAPGKPRAEGDIVYVFGRVSDEDGEPVKGALIEVWQANKWGKYDHPFDSTEEPLDSNFRGFGRALSDTRGLYSFLTIKPGAYPNPGYDNWMRPPHIHFCIFAAGLMQRLITQMYFPGEPLNDVDPILNAVADLDERALLISSERQSSEAPKEAKCYRFDIVLRGGRETPFFVDPRQTQQRPD